MNAEIETIRLRYFALLNRLDGDVGRHPFSVRATHDGDAHFELRENGTFALVTTERGAIVDEFVTDDADALLYERFRMVTGEMASQYAARETGENKQFRKVMFNRQLELMGKLSSEWRERLAWEIAEKLASHPLEKKAPTPQGTNAYINRSSWLGWLIVCAAGLGLIGVLHLPLYFTGRDQAALESHGRSVEGTIVDRTETMLRFAETYSITYRVEIAGQTHEQLEKVGEHRFALAEPGDRIDVIYLPDDPQTFAIKGNDRFGRLLVIYAIIDLLLIIAVGWNWVRIRGELARERESTPRS